MVFCLKKVTMSQHHEFHSDRFQKSWDFEISGEWLLENFFGSDKVFKKEIQTPIEKDIIFQTKFSPQEMFSIMVSVLDLKHVIELDISFEINDIDQIQIYQSHSINRFTPTRTSKEYSFALSQEDLDKFQSDNGIFCIQYKVKHRDIFLHIEESYKHLSTKYLPPIHAEYKVDFNNIADILTFGQSSLFNNHPDLIIPPLNPPPPPQTNKSTNYLYESFLNILRMSSVFSNNVIPNVRLQNSSFSNELSAIMNKASTDIFEAANDLSNLLPTESSRSYEKLIQIVSKLNENIKNDHEITTTIMTDSLSPSPKDFFEVQFTPNLPVKEMIEKSSKNNPFFRSQKFFRLPKILFLLFHHNNSNSNSFILDEKITLEDTSNKPHNYILDSILFRTESGEYNSYIHNQSTWSRYSKSDTLQQSFESIYESFSYPKTSDIIDMLIYIEENAFPQNPPSHIISYEPPVLPTDQQEEEGSPGFEFQRNSSGEINLFNSQNDQSQFGNIIDVPTIEYNIAFKICSGPIFKQIEKECHFPPEDIDIFPFPSTETVEELYNFLESQTSFSGSNIVCFYFTNFPLFTPLSRSEIFLKDAFGISFDNMIGESQTDENTTINPNITLFFDEAQFNNDDKIVALYLFIRNIKKPLRYVTYKVMPDTTTVGDAFTGQLNSLDISKTHFWSIHSKTTVEEPPDINDLMDNSGDFTINPNFLKDMPRNNEICAQECSSSSNICSVCEPNSSLVILVAESSDRLLISPDSLNSSVPQHYQYISYRDYYLIPSSFEEWLYLSDSVQTILQEFDKEAQIFKYPATLTYKELARRIQIKNSTDEYVGFFVDNSGNGYYSNLMDDDEVIVPNSHVYYRFFKDRDTFINNYFAVKVIDIDMNEEKVILMKNEKATIQNMLRSYGITNQNVFAIPYDNQNQKPLNISQPNDDVFPAFTYYLQKLDPSKLESYNIAYFHHMLTEVPKEYHHLFPRAFLHESAIKDILGFQLKYDIIPDPESKSYMILMQN